MFHKFSTIKDGADRKTGKSVLISGAIHDTSQNTYFDMTPPADAGQKWTISFWMKGGFKNCTSSGGGKIFNVGAQADYPGGAIGGTYIGLNTSGTLGFGNDNKTDVGWWHNTKMIFRDSAAWYHVVMRFDSTQANQNDRAIIYVNGYRAEIDTSSIAYPAQNGLTWMFSNRSHRIGTSNDSVWSYPFDGLLSEFYGISGESYGPEEFAELTSKGEYIPKEFSGTYGSAGFYLSFSDPDKLGLDSSENGNDFMGTRVYPFYCWDDYPTNNFPTWESNWTSRGTDRSYMSRDFVAGNTLVDVLRVGDASYFNQSANILFPGSGKWYFEFNKVRVLADNPDYWMFGLYDPNEFYSNHAPYVDNNCLYTTYTTGTNTLDMWFDGLQSSASFPESPIDKWFGMGVDRDNNEVTLWYQGTKLSSIDISTWPFTDMAAMAGRGGNDSGWNIDTSRINFGQCPSGWAGSDFALPEGFKTLSTANLRDPSFDISTNFSSTTYAGSGVEQEVTTGVDADLVWIKDRVVAYNHVLFDSIREATRAIYTNATGAQVTDAQTLRYFNNNGFTVGTNDGVNGVGSAYVSYNFKGGDANVVNNDGTIPTIVSANKDLGFSIIRYDGTGNNGTIGHGLGKPPTFVLMVRNYQDNSSNLSMSNKLIDWTYSMILNATHEQDTYGGTMTQAPDSSVFYLGNHVETNKAGRDHILYCFTDSEFVRSGYFKGNGSPDGIAVELPFSPQWLLVKCIQGARTNWILADSARDPTNIVTTYFYPDLPAVDSNYNTFNFYSNGFQLKTSGVSFNGTGYTYEYLAIGHKNLKQARGR